MKFRVSALFQLPVIALIFPVFLAAYSLVETQPFDPALSGRLTVHRYDGRLLNWKGGYVFTKDPFDKNASWKKWKKVRPEEFRISMTDGRGTRLIDIPDAKDFSFSADGNTAAFTAAFGLSPVSTAAVVDLKQDRIIYSIALKQKGPGSKGPPQLPMENFWFLPSVSSDGSFFVCGGFKGTGEREAAIVNINSKQRKELVNCAFPGISGGNIFFLRLDPKERKAFLVMRPLKEGPERSVKMIDGTAVGLEIMDRGGYLITGDKVFSFETVSGTGFKEIYNFSRDSGAFKIWNIERTYSGYYKGRGYLFFAVKKMKSDKYEWGLYAMEVE